MSPDSASPSELESDWASGQEFPSEWVTESLSGWESLSGSAMGFPLAWAFLSDSEFRVELEFPKAIHPAPPTDWAMDSDSATESRSELDSVFQLDSATELPSVSGSEQQSAPPREPRSATGLESESEPDLEPGSVTEQTAPGSGPESGSELE